MKMPKIQFSWLFAFVVLVASAVLMFSLVTQAPSEAQMDLMRYARERDIDFEVYPNSLLKLLDRNPETEEFVRNYPFRLEQAADLGGYDARQGVPLFLQWDERWGYLTCGGDFVGCSGSAPMCLAMAGCYISGGEAKFYPDKIVAFADENGYYGDDLISMGGKALGLKVTGLTREEQKIATYLKNGDPIIASTGFGDFENYIVLTGYYDGTVTLKDPDSKVNSEKEWAYEDISRQFKKIWVIQKSK